MKKPKKPKPKMSLVGRIYIGLIALAGVIKPKGIIEYSNLGIKRFGEHQRLRRQQHNSGLSKYSHADFNPAKSIIREANKWPMGHKKTREKERNLRKITSSKG